MISQILNDLAQRIDQFRGVILIGTDGFTVDKLLPEDSGFEQVVVEHIGVIKKIASLAESLDLGNPIELAIIGDKLSIVFYHVTVDYFLALGVDPQVSIGRARYELKRAAIPLRRELSG